MTISDFNQNELDDLARFICKQHIPLKSKEMFAMAIADEYNVAHDLRFRRMSTIPGLEEDI